MSPRDRDRRQPYTPAKGTEIAVPHYVSEPGTGVVEGDDLARVRARRPTPERLSRLETRQDATDDALGDVRELVGRMDEKQDALIKAFDDDRAERKAAREKSEAFWRAVKLKAIGAVFSGTVVLAVLRKLGWL